MFLLALSRPVLPQVLTLALSLALFEQVIMSLLFSSSRRSWATLSRGVPSTRRLVFLGAWSGTGALRSVPSTDVSQALALLLGALLTLLMISPNHAFPWRVPLRPLLGTYLPKPCYAELLQMNLRKKTKCLTQNNSLLIAALASDNSISSPTV